MIVITVQIFPKYKDFAEIDGHLLLGAGISRGGANLVPGNCCVSMPNNVKNAVGDFYKKPI
jgi:hypothetical protein